VALGRLLKTDEDEPTTNYTGHPSSALHGTPQTSNVSAHGGARCSSHGVSTADNLLVASGAGPDSGSLALHGVLTTEGALVLCMLGDLDLLEDLSERGTITGTVLANNAYLLGTTSLQWRAGFVV